MTPAAVIAENPRFLKGLIKVMKEEMIGKNTAEGIANAAVSALAEAGFVIVPREPDEAMEKAAHDLVEDCAIHNLGAPPNPMDIWAAMITAAEKE